MLHLNLARAFRAKGILKQYRFLKNMGFYDAKATRLKDNQEKVIRLDELETLCYNLWCTPNDIFDWEPDAKYPVLEGHPINLIKRAAEADLYGKSRVLTMEQLKEVSKLMDEMIAQNREELK